MRLYKYVPCLALLAISSHTLFAQSLYKSVCQEARHISRGSLVQPMTSNVWHSSLAQRRTRWHEMLGLLPMPERSPLQATITGVLERGDYVVEKIHFQSLPGVYVAGNLYRPAKLSGRLPTVLYLCGHTKGKVSKTYQENPRWFGQHGYVALVLDPIQLGESQGFHHGTYRDQRWDWVSRGYTPLGTEVWNAIRALDYLETRDDVDKERMGVTGLSGGGVVSWALGAADERVKVVVPVCQSGSMEDVVVDRATDGHCDCAFWINYYRWCWPDLGSLIAPRAFMIASGTEDTLWRPTGFRDVAHRIRHQYNALGVGDQFSLYEEQCPHGYTPSMRKAIFGWFDTHLRSSDKPVDDDVTDYVEPEKELLVFNGELPKDDKMQVVDTLLVKQGNKFEAPDRDAWQSHQKQALARLRKLTFRHTPVGGIPRINHIRQNGGEAHFKHTAYYFDVADGLTLSALTMGYVESSEEPPIVVSAMHPDRKNFYKGSGISGLKLSPPFTLAGIEVRNTGATSVGPGYLWTLRRTYPLLGQTLPERQVADLLSGVALMRQINSRRPITLYGEGHTAVLAIYAALLDPGVNEVILSKPPATHENPNTPEFLGVLRVGDLPHNLALLWPRPITFIDAVPPGYEYTREVYGRLGNAERVRVLKKNQEWQPFK